MLGRWYLGPFSWRTVQVLCTTRFSQKTLVFILYGWCSLRAKGVFCLEAAIQTASFSVHSSSGWAPPPGHKVSSATLASACIQTLPPNVTTSSKNWVLQLTFFDVLVLLCCFVWTVTKLYLFWSMCVCFEILGYPQVMWSFGFNFLQFSALGSLFEDIILLKI